jgi:hypothetical protein
VHLGPGWGAILGWAVAALAVGALALKRRRRPAARGAAGALVLFGLLGWIVTFGGVVPAAVFALVLGLPLLTSVDAALRPADERDPGASLVIATTLLGVVLVAWVAGAWFGLEAAATIVGCAVAAVLAAVLEGRMQGAPQLG